MKSSAAPLIFFLLFGIGVTSAQNPNTTTLPGAFVDVDGGRLYYQECGTGPEAVVLIHDGIAHSAVWDDVWPTFCKQFHTIRYDRRGYGRSPAATTWYSETEDLATLLHSRRVKRAILVGSSHGGELSIDFTLQYPDLVKQLVLVGAVVSGFPYTDHFLNRGMANSRPFETGDVAQGLSNWSKDRYLLAPGHEAAQKRLLAILTANPQDMTHADFVRPTRPALPRLSEIRIPTLILVGDADIPDVHAHAGAIEAGITGSRRMIISDAGHLMYLEKPEEFSRVVIPFIESNIE
ncbi:MAG TPA: alpha/beta hydrolase [Terriglobales bacterium]|jgi:3-oxoadipate enol-lactonase|nr:alpha/beta hydrolase [Terriglobales bacterium]